MHGRTTEFINRPHEDCADGRCFKRLIDLAVANGLTVETQSINPSGSSMRIHGRFCFDPVLAKRIRREFTEDEFPDALRAASSYQPRCGSTWTIPKETRPGAREISDVLRFHVLDRQYGLVKYDITTRSTFAIYRFLGRILGSGAVDKVLLHQRTPSEDARLLAVTRGGSAGACFVDIEYEGSHYCVPAAGGEHTKQTFSVLAQLLALKTRAGDLAITPSVRITP